MNVGGMEMNKYYFTFGTAEHFPFKAKEYLVVCASSMNEAAKIFRTNYPDHTPGLLNCAFVYDEKQFEPIKEKIFYSGEPVKVLGAV